MPRYKLVNGERVQLTAAEETARTAKKLNGMLVHLIELCLI